MVCSAVFLTFKAFQNLGHFLVIQNCNFLQFCSSWISGFKNLRIQDSRSRKNFLNPAPPRFKIQGLGKTSWVQRPLSPERLDSRSFFGSWSWILNLEPGEAGFKKFFLDLESWILNLESGETGFKKFFVDLESWIWNPGLDSRSFS